MDKILLKNIPHFPRYPIPRTQLDIPQCVFLLKSTTRELYPDYVDFKLEWLVDKSTVLSMKGRPLFVMMEKMISPVILHV